MAMTTITASITDMKLGAVMHKGEQRTWQGDHPILRPLCAPQLFILIMEERIDEVVITSPTPISGEIFVK